MFITPTREIVPVKRFTSRVARLDICETRAQLNGGSWVGEPQGECLRHEDRPVMDDCRGDRCCSRDAVRTSGQLPRQACANRGSVRRTTSPFSNVEAHIRGINIPLPAHTSMHTTPAIPGIIVIHEFHVHFDPSVLSPRHKEQWTPLLPINHTL